MNRRSSAQHLIACGMIIAACICTISATPEITPADSIRYHQLRERLSSDGATQAVRATADALAKEGLFEEAIEILEAFPSTAPQEASAPEKQSLPYIEKQWRISAGADYYRLEDIDTAIMTREEYQDYQRLTQTPLSFWSRGKCQIDVNGGLFEQFAPEVYVSNYRASFEAPARLSAIDDRLTLEAAAKAGKWFQADATGPVRFAPAGQYPSDMGGASSRISFESRSDENRRWSWTTPVIVDWEHYREDRTGYESFVEFRVSPTLEYRRSGDISFSARFSGDAQYENYYRPESDTLEVVRGILQIDNSIRAAHWQLQPKFEWLVDRYINAAAPGRIDRWKAALRAEQGHHNRFSPQMAAHILHELEQYYVTNNLTGTEVRISPAVRINATKTIYLEPELSYERRWADLKGNDYVWQAHSRMEALLHGTITVDRLDGTLLAGYRGEDVAANFESFTNDSRSLLLGADGTVSFGNRISVNARLDYEYRSYAPYDDRSRMSENLTAAGNVSVNW